MLKRWSVALLIILAIIVVMTGAGSNAAIDTIVIDQAAIKIILQPATTLLMSVDNRADNNSEVIINIEILDPRDDAKLKLAKLVQLTGGKNRLELPLALTESNSETPYYRLKYQVTDVAKSQIIIPTKIISFTQLIEPLFDLQVNATDYLFVGSNFNLEVHTRHPLTAQPIKDVSIQAQITNNEQIIDSLSLIGRTDSNGQALLNVALPAEMLSGSERVKVQATLGILNQTVELDLHIVKGALARIQTDKPLYQPGQLIQARVLMTDYSNRPLADEDIDVTLFDDNQELPNTETNRARVIEQKLAAAMDKEKRQLTGLCKIAGLVLDETGALIAGAELKLTDQASGATRVVTSGEEGSFTFTDLTPSYYNLECRASGFKSSLTTDIRVDYDFITDVKVVMAISGEVDMVDVRADVINVATKTSTDNQHQPATQRSNKIQLSTPRIRDNFIETLLWQPQINVYETGRAQINFKLADNITTWKLAIVGSTIDGKLGFVEKEFTSIQQFFIEHEPPPVLTVGDEIKLPVVLRNYLKQPLKVNVEMKPEQWFTLLGNNNQQCSVPAKDAARRVFNFRVDQAIKQGKQQIIAIGKQAGDGIEKRINAHANGQEIAQIDSLLYGQKSSLKIDLPNDLITDSLTAQLKIYPNLMAHALEGIEGILQRPYGCAEQTISTSYASLMVLRYYQENRLSPNQYTIKAEQYLRAGYQRLLGFQHSDGGFGYWHNDQRSDVALTAYAIRFLTDLSQIITVDLDVKLRAQQWLIAQQQADGSWPVSYSYYQYLLRSLNLTAYTTRMLIASGLPRQSEAINRAVQYLETNIDKQNINDPYLIANCALALFDQFQVSTNRAKLLVLLARLRGQVVTEANYSFWKHSQVTPFYGWGRAADIETTALVLQAIQAISSDNADQDLINKGLAFLLRNKDRYGVWYSTQATINVLETMISLTKREQSYQGGPLVIMVNNQKLPEISGSDAKEPHAPIAIDITTYLRNGKNKVEIISAEPETNLKNSPLTSVAMQVNSTYYRPWDQQLFVEEVTSNGVKLYVSFDKTRAAINEEITCYVKAARIDKNSYGMLLGEIGLPPGMEVDRASLEQARHDQGAFLFKYEVLPDRVVVYLWPDREEAFFKFKFHGRYGVKAMSGPSQLYDYYNPDARVVIAPRQFVIE